jgi:pSer/pThr/pTyr-binding forkhead associated (FHA) protein
LKPPVILKIFKDNKLHVVKQFDQDQITFGNGAEVDVNLEDPGVSAIHCLIELRETGYYVADLGSVHGTFKNERQVLDEVISSGDQLGVGAFTVSFYVGVPKPKTPPPVGLGQATNMSNLPPANLVQTEESSDLVQETTAPHIPVLEVTVKTKVTSKNPSKAKTEIKENKETQETRPEPKPEPKAKIPSKPLAETVPPVIVAPSKPTLPSRTPGQKEKRSKNFHTFAPAAVIPDLQAYFQPTKGPQLEVVVVWKDRVLNVLHFAENRTLTIGSEADCDIQLPTGIMAQRAPFLESLSGTRIFLGTTWLVSVRQAVVGVQDLAQLQAQGKVGRQGNISFLKLDQNEVARLEINSADLEIYVRHVPVTPIPPLLGSDLTGSEITGLIFSFVIVGLLALYMAVYPPTAPVEDKNEDQLRLAQFIYKKPPEIIKPPPPPAPEPVAEKKPEATPPPPKATPPPQKLKKVEVVDKAQEAKGAAKPSPVKETKAARAEDVRPMNNKKPKIFTSTKQGGAVKLSNSDSANAQSAKDVNKTGLLSAFAGGGTREKLDQAYSGQGEMLGLAGKATGTSGQNSDRAGSDLGSQFKDAGAGGKGTATQGISGIKTVGRSSGQSSYGQVGSGGKGRVNIEVGGSGAAFVGSVDREAVRRVVRSIYAQIKNCYERGLRSNSDLEGKIVVHWEVADQGHVVTAKVKDAPGELRSIAECVAIRIRDQRFPEPPAGSIYEVDFPFMMGKQQ